MPVEPNLEVTDVGAFGSENVAACAVGTNNETNSDVARAIEPKPRVLLNLIFMGKFKYQTRLFTRWNGYKIVDIRLTLCDSKQLIPINDLQAGFAQWFSCRYFSGINCLPMGL